MEAEYILNTAETIRQQLVHLTDMNILMSWGINKINMMESNYLSFDFAKKSLKYFCL
jgi:hypothetical protein